MSDMGFLDLDQELNMAVQKLNNNPNKELENVRSEIILWNVGINSVAESPNFDPDFSLTLVSRRICSSRGFFFFRTIR